METALPLKVRPGQDRARLGTDFLAEQPSPPALRPSPRACPRHGLQGMLSPDGVPSGPRWASAAFTPKAGIPRAQLRGHHF